MEQGQRGFTALFLLSGTAAIVQAQQERDLKHALAEVSRGAMVGEAALLEEFGIRAATVIASKEGCVFWELKKEHFKEIIWKFPTQKEIFDQLVILRAEKTRTKIGDLKAKRARELAKTRNQNRTPDGKIKVRLRERDRQKM